MFQTSFLTRAVCPLVNRGDNYPLRFGNGGYGGAFCNGAGPRHDLANLTGLSSSPELGPFSLMSAQSFHDPIFLRRFAPWRLLSVI